IFLFPALFLLVSYANAQGAAPTLRGTVEDAHKALRTVDGVVSPAPAPCPVDGEIPKAIPVEGPTKKNVAESISAELVIERTLSPFMKTCFDSLDKINPPKTFEEAIRLAIDFNFEPQ